MGIKSLHRSLLLIVFFALVPCALTFASDSGIVTIQGVVMVVDLKNNLIIVNEKTFLFDQNTVIHNEKGLPVTVDQLKPRAWVYLEGVDDKTIKRVVTRKIHLVPKGSEKKSSFSLISN